MDKQLQPTTIDNAPQEVKDAHVTFADNESLQRQLYVDFCAMGGLLTDEDGVFTRMTAGEFAKRIGVDRTTLYGWKKRIPEFDAKVRARRIQISKGARASKVYNGLYLRASKGDAPAVKLWAEIFDDYQPAAQKHKVDLSDNVAELMGMARNRKEAIEGEVILDK